MDVIFKLKLHLSREHIYWIISVSRDNVTSISREQLRASSFQVLAARVGRHTTKEEEKFLYICLPLFLTGFFFQGFGGKRLFPQRESKFFQFSFLLFT